MKVLGVTLSNPWCLKNIGMNEGFVYSGIESLIADDINDSLKYFVEDGFINFHESFDFKPISDVYDEDGIKHLDMQRKCLGKTE